MIFQNCPKFHSPNGSWNYVEQFWNITRGINAKYHYKSCYYQTELDDRKSYYQLIIKITISEKKKIAKLCDNGRINIKNWQFSSLYTVSMVIETKVVIGWFKLQL